MASLLLTALLAAVPSPVANAVAEAALPDRALVASVQALPKGCAVHSAQAPRIVRSAKVAVRVSGTDANGRPCGGWVFAQVRVFRAAAVLQKDVRRGELLDGAWAQKDVEVLGAGGLLAEVSQGARATRTLLRGATLREDDVTSAPEPGTEVTVVWQRGGLHVERAGRVLACGRGVCARVGDAVVEGRLLGGKLVVEP